MRLRLSLEISIALLAALSLLLTLPPLNFPIFGIFVFWGGAFLLGSPNLEGVKKMVPPAILGTIFAVATFLLFQAAAPLAGGSLLGGTLVNMVILFVVAALLVYCARIPAFSTIAAAFCSFAVFVGTAAGSYGLEPHGLFNFWLAATLMCCLGPLFAWASVALTRPASAVVVEETVIKG